MNATLARVLGLPGNVSGSLSCLSSSRSPHPPCQPVPWSPRHPCKPVPRPCLCQSHPPCKPMPRSRWCPSSSNQTTQDLNGDSLGRAEPWRDSAAELAGLWPGCTAWVIKCPWKQALPTRRCPPPSRPGPSEPGLTKGKVRARSQEGSIPSTTAQVSSPRQPQTSPSTPQPPAPIAMS